MTQRTLPFLLLMCISTAVSAQEKDFPRVEGFVGYSGVFTDSILIKTGPGASGQTDLDSAAGFESAIVGNVNRTFGIKGDVSVHFGRYKEQDFTVPCPLPTCPTQTANSHTRLFNFLAGPELKLRNHTRLTPFADALFGLAHTSTFFRTNGSSLNFTGTTADTGFATAFGGGLDVRLLHRFSFRFSSDYDLAQGQTSPVGSSKTLHSWRISLGILFR